MSNLVGVNIIIHIIQVRGGPTIRENMIFSVRSKISNNDVYLSID